MPQRLIYNPRVWVYTKDANEVLRDVSNYVVAGKIERLINQVSTAEIKLRNPDKIFTSPSVGVAFHPMDPITIFLQRINGHPVQVFTGFLDQTPYYQMFPGTVTLKASCTLKRLLYTFFDPALPFFTSFLNEYGWEDTVEGTLINRGAAHRIGPDQSENNPELVTFGSNKGEKPGKAGANDTSLGRLLWALLYHVADIKHEHIYIEAIPTSVATLVSRLLKDFTKGQEQAGKELEYFLQELIGTSSQGTGGAAGGTGGVGSTGTVHDIKKIVATMTKIAKSLGVPPAFVITTAKAESGLDPNNVGREGAIGYFQFYGEEPYPGVHGTKDAKDLGLSTEEFCKAALTLGGGLKPESQWREWAIKTQRAVSNAYGNWTAELAEAKKLISEYGSENKLQPNSETFGPTPVEETQKGTTAPGKEEGNTKYVNPFKSATKGETDEGVDFTGTGPIGAFGPAKVVYSNPRSGWYVTTHGNEAFLVYELLTGTHKGKFIYIAEDIGKLAPVGTVVKGGPSDPVCEFLPGSIEMGWAAGAEPAVAPFSKGSGREGSAPEGGKDFQKFYEGQPSTGGPSGGGGSGETEEGKTSVTDPLIAAKTAQFTSEIAFPGLEEKVEAELLSGQRALMNDVPLLPFVQQVAQASMRSFMSLPNGDFYAFYPDYFGEMGHHPAYWLIHDIEVLDGGINLNDTNLASHVYVVGDNTWPINEKLLNEINSSGVVNVFNAFTAETVDRSQAHAKNTKDLKGVSPPPPFAPKENVNLVATMDVEEAKKFLERYGARPVVLNLPMIRSPLYEMLMAYQAFHLAWSRLFMTPFTFTFMPELFPGGKVGFPDHGIQMYIEGVTHAWDLESGFTTEAKLSAPSLLAGANATNHPELPPDMVNALSEPVKKKKK